MEGATRPNDATRIESAALRLQPVCDADLPAFFAQQDDAGAHRMAAFTARDHSDRTAFLAHWAKIRADPTVTIRAILADDQLAGHVASFSMDGRREVTYWLGRAHWGRGLATRALDAFIRTVETTRPLHAVVADDNVGSRRVLEKCGFVVYGKGRAYSRPRGGQVDELFLELERPADAAVAPTGRGEPS